MTQNADTNLWIDDRFDNVDFSSHPDDQELLDDVIDEDPIMRPEIVTNVPALQQPAIEPAITVTPEPDEPEVITTPEGFIITIEKTAKGWCAQLDPNNGAPVEKFYGKTKNEMMLSMATGKLNASMKIRSQNRQIKLGDGAEPQAPKPNQIPQPTVRKLTADEIFDIKTKLQSDPDLALHEWFQKSTGLNVAQLVQLAQNGQAAKMDLDMETVAQDFKNRNPDYYRSTENYSAIVAYLGKNKIRRTLTTTNGDDIIAELYQGGFWTVRNLEEAYEDLKESGLLLQAPRQPQATVPAQVPTPAPASTDERIVRRETRPRAGLGIRTAEVSSPAPAAQPLPDEDPNTWSDERLELEFQKGRRAYLSSRR